MATTVQLSIHQMADLLRKAGVQAKRSLDIGGQRAAQRAHAAVVAATPVDQGQMKNGWRVAGRQVINEAPHAGIVIKGARPHNTSRAGIEAIIRWAMRVLQLDEKAAKRVAWGKAANLRKYGQKPNDFITPLLPMFNLWIKEEVETQLRRRTKAGKL